MKFRLKLSMRVNEEEGRLIDSRTSEYIYDNNKVGPSYSGFTNGFNYIGFCSYREGNNWIIYGDLVEFDKFKVEMKKFENYLEYIKMGEIYSRYRKDIKLIIEGESMKIRTIQNLMNLYFNYKPMIKSFLRLEHISLNEEEVNNLNELADSTDELPEDIIDLAIENKVDHKLYSPINLTEYPSLIIRGYELDFELIKMYFQFLLALVAKADRNISVKKNNQQVLDNEKYRMRSLLRNLGFNGEEHKDLRRAFLKNLSGNVAFRVLRTA